MDDNKKETKAASKKGNTAAATAAAAKKKRANSRPPQEGKATKKKKKDTANANATVDPAAPVAVTTAAASNNKKRKKAAVAAPAASAAASTVPASATSTAASTTALNTTTAGANVTTAATNKKTASAPKTTPVVVANPIPATVALDKIDWKSQPLVDHVLYRLTEGVPRLELKTMEAEANECEKELLREIQLLEDSLETEQAQGETTTKKEAQTTAANPKTGDKKKEADEQVDIILDSPLTPLDRYFTLSAHLGRLRDELAMPSIRKPSPALLAATAAASGNNKKKKANSTPAPTYTQLMEMASENPNYIMAHPDPPTQLLQVWRKIASHRTSTVFRKPVKPEEAPGYAERILFPMDLSLVRKMIVARILTSYSEVHQKIRLICHNCVKYNGRESDYGIVAREFEAVVDEYIYNATQQPVTQGTLPTGKAQAAKAPGSGRSSPKNAGGISGRSSPKLVGAAASGRASPKTVGRPPLNKKLAPATSTTAASSASIAAATAAAAAAVAPKPASAPTSKGAGKKTK